MKRRRAFLVADELLVSLPAALAGVESSATQLTHEAVTLLVLPRPQTWLCQTEEKKNLLRRLGGVKIKIYLSNHLPDFSLFFFNCHLRLLSPDERAK